MNTAKPLYQQLASLVQARLNCIERGNHEWNNNHTQTLHNLVKEHLPSGSGFDNGTTIDLSECLPDKLVLHTSYHHMDEHGGYCGWTEHKVVVTPSLAFGFNVKVSGPNKNDIKEYIAESFNNDLAVLVA